MRPPLPRAGRTVPTNGHMSGTVRTSVAESRTQSSVPRPHSLPALPQKCKRKGLLLPAGCDPGCKRYVSSPEVGEGGKWDLRAPRTSSGKRCFFASPRGKRSRSKGQLPIWHRHSTYLEARLLVSCSKPPKRVRTNSVRRLATYKTSSSL